MPPTRLVLAVAVTAAAALLAAGGIALAADPAVQPTGGTAVSTCDNPVLNQGLAGWGRLSGAPPVRVREPDHHPSAVYSYVQPRNPTTTPSAYLPQQPIDAAHPRWDFGADARANAAGQMRVGVDWYTAQNRWIGHDNGPWIATPGGTLGTWARISGQFSAPPAAAGAHVLMEARLPWGANWGITACSYTPTVPAPPPVTPPTTTVPPPPTTPPTTPPPAADTAAAVHGWGTPIAAGSDEFTGTGLDPAKWGQPEGCWPPNPTVRGGRCGDHNSVHDGYLDEHGTPDGKTGYVSSTFNQRYGRWEARMRVTTTVPGRAFHPVLLTWPQSEQWPSGGELDYLEIDSDSTHAQAFIHHTDGGQDGYVGPAVEFSQWHNYAVDWQPGHIRGFIDGVQWFDSTSPLSQPPGPHHATAQLDNFVGTSGMADVHLQVDWYRAYAP